MYADVLEQHPTDNLSPTCEPTGHHPVAGFYPNTIKLLIPANFDLAKFIAERPALKHQADKVVWSLSKVRHIQNFKGEKPDCFVDISQWTIRDHIPIRHANAIWNGLLEEQILECDETWSKRDHYSKGYRFGPEYRVNFKEHEITDKILIKKIIDRRISRNHQPAQVQDFDETYKKLFFWQTQIKIDRTQAIRSMNKRALENGIVDVSSYLQVIDAIEKQNLEFHVIESGRLCHLPSRMFKEGRDALRINDNQLGTLDLKNSQWIFLANKIRKDHQEKIASRPNSLSAAERERESEKASLSCYISETSRKGIEHFCQLVESGEIYEFMVKELNARVSAKKAITDRQRMKTALLIYVLAGDDSQKHIRESEVALTFKECFPAVYSYITNYKRHDYKQLVIDLQGDEATFIIGTVCRRLVNEHPDVPLVTIHDAIMTTPEYLTLVHGVMVEEFKKLGCTPQIHVVQTKGEQDDHRPTNGASSEGDGETPQACSLVLSGHVVSAVSTLRRPAHGEPRGDEHATDTLGPTEALGRPSRGRPVPLQLVCTVPPDTRIRDAGRREDFGQPQRLREDALLTRR